MTQGYFLLALGQRYIDECSILTQTIRKQRDSRPVSLLINECDLDYAKSKRIFDGFTFFTPEESWKQCITDFEKYCLYPRINFDKMLPYEENIILDSDVLCQYDPNKVWNYMSKRISSIGMLGRKNDPGWHWGKIREVSDAFGKHIPHVHGGFFYLRREPFTEDFFAAARTAFSKYDEYGCKREFRGGRVDEILFAICHSYFGMWPIEFDEFPIMTFNYHPNIEVPSKLQTEGARNVDMDDYIPFVHMFDKMDGFNYKSLLAKIMSSDT